VLLATVSGLSAQIPPMSGPLHPYASCQFDDGLQMVRFDNLPPGVKSREVDTDSGPRTIDLLAGVRIMFAYPGSDFYANVKVEGLPAGRYAELKKSLIDNFDHMAHGNTVNRDIQTPFHGLELHGLDREKLEGGVLGVYLFFDDSTRVVTTIYLLNQEPTARKFQTIEEYRKLRDHFLTGYAGCIEHNNLQESR
jgi:hypothetical protein